LDGDLTGQLAYLLEEEEEEDLLEAMIEQFPNHLKPK